MDLKKISLLSRIAGAFIGGILGLFVGPIALLIMTCHPQNLKDPKDAGTIICLMIIGWFSITMAMGLFYGLGRGIYIGIKGGIDAALKVPKELFTISRIREKKYWRAYKLLEQIKTQVLINDFKVEVERLYPSIQEIIDLASEAEDEGYFIPDSFINELNYLLGKIYVKTQQHDEAIIYFSKIANSSSLYSEAQTLTNLCRGLQTLNNKPSNESITEKLIRLGTAEKYLVEANNSNDAHDLLLAIQRDVGITKYKLASEKNHSLSDKSDVKSSQKPVIGASKNQHNFFSLSRIKPCFVTKNNQNDIIDVNIRTMRTAISKAY